MICHVWLQLLVGGLRGPLPLLSLQALPTALACTPSAIWEPVIPEVHINHPSLHF